MLDKKDSSLPYLLLFTVFLSLEAYFIYEVDRTENIKVLSLFSCLFAIYILFLLKRELNTQHILSAALVTRLILLFAIPNLSDDFYRFIWDGRLLNEGINPFLFKPSYFINENASIDGLNMELFQALNSQHYFTIYPPISQLVFWASVKLSPSSILGSIIAMRAFIILADMGLLIIMTKTLKHYGHSNRYLLVYALNPLVIVELTGNLHFEGIMLFFLFCALWFIIKHWNLWSAALISLSISTKLIPLMFLPGLFRKLGLKQLTGYYLGVGIFTSIIFLVSFDIDFIVGLKDSITLFFKSFEFNGGIFFLVREIGFIVKGYDIVGSAGPAMALLALELIIIYALVCTTQNMNIGLVLATILFTQLALATTVHPWYVIPLLALGCVSKLRFPIAWSFLIFFTYIGYDKAGYEQPFWVIALEYIIILPLAVLDLYRAHQEFYISEK